MSYSEYDANKDLAQHKEQLKRDKLKLTNQMHQNAIRHQRKLRWEFYRKCFITVFVLGFILYIIDKLSRGSK